MFFVNILIETARKNDFERQKFGSLVASVADHNSLVSSATNINAGGDLRALFDEIRDNFKAIIFGDLMYEVGDVDVLSSRSDFSGDEDLTMTTASFDGDTGIRIGGEIGIKNSIGDAVAKFVRVPRRNAFGGAI